jgi:hypothetical protein
MDVSEISMNGSTQKSHFRITSETHANKTPQKGSMAKHVVNKLLDKTDHKTGLGEVTRP